MLSDEEKKATELLNKRYEFFKENPLATNVWLTLDIHNLGIVLNIIEKQSKEIEELKKYKEGYKLLSLVEEQQHKIEKLINANDNLKKTKRIKNMEYVNQNYVSKDKIKAKIEEVKDGTYDAKIVLQSLLEKE